VSVPAQPYGSFAPPPGLRRDGVGVLTFGIGLIVSFGLVVYALWLTVAAVAARGNASDHAAGSVVGATPRHAVAVTPPASPLPPPTPNNATLAFDQLWVSGNGNTIVVGAPTVGFSPLTGESMIQVPVTLTNNDEQDWSSESTSFIGTLNHAPLAESTEGDWMYRAPIVPHTSVILNKIFIGHPGQFTLQVSTPNGVASFSGQI
jgi:hypothetical protein